MVVISISRWVPFPPRYYYILSNYKVDITHNNTKNNNNSRCYNVCTQFAYHLDNIYIIQSYGYMITWLGRWTLMDSVPRGRIQHMLTHRRQHPLHSFDIPFFNYDDIFSFLFFYFFFEVFFVIFILCLPPPTCAVVGPDNIICYSARLDCYCYIQHRVVSGGFLSRAT